MKEYKFNGHKLEVYDSIEELPITRFQMYNLNLLIDGGVGSDLSDFDRHISNAKKLVTRDPDSALKELTNLQMNVHFVMGKTSPEMNSFAVMIYKLDGRLIEDEDLSEEGTKKIIAELGRKRLTIHKMKDIMKAVKKKLDGEFDVFFPKVANSPSTKEFYSKLQFRTSLVLKNIGLSSKEISEKIEAIDEFFISRIKPKAYSGNDGLEVQMTKSFESTCFFLRQHNIASDPKSLLHFLLPD